MNMQRMVICARAVEKNARKFSRALSLSLATGYLNVNEAERDEDSVTLNKNLRCDVAS